MIPFLRRLLHRKHYPLNEILISQKNLVHNYQYLSSINPEIQVVPVLKSNAYGHGIVQIGSILETQNTPFFAVDSLYEAYQLTNAGIKRPILIMGYIDPKSLMRKKLPYAYAVWDLGLAETINKYQKGAEVHIFVDTGMHREGVLLDDLTDFAKKLREMKNIKVVGILSHLAISHDSSHKVTRDQIANFRRAIAFCQAENIHFKWRALGGGESLLYIKDLPCNVVRTGKSLYGISDKEELKPVLSMNTKITQIKKIGKGESIGYDATFAAKKEMTIGTLPMGYFDGIDRRLSNKGVVMVGGVACQILGRVSMNLTTLDLSEVSEPFVGQLVQVFSNDPNDPNSVAKAAKICETIPYDLLVHLAFSTRRTVLND